MGVKESAPHLLLLLPPLADLLGAPCPHHLLSAPHGHHGEPRPHHRPGCNQIKICCIKKNLMHIDANVVITSSDVKPLFPFRVWDCLNIQIKAWEIRALCKFLFYRNFVR